MPEQDAESALVVLRSAIQDEIAGQRFYNEAAYHCFDPWAKEIFSTLASDEDTHTRLLLLEYESLLSDGCWVDPEDALAASSTVDITRLTFPSEESSAGVFSAHGDTPQEIDRRSNDLDALAFGVRMEAKAIDLYSRGAQESADSNARRAYELLVREETRHYQNLKDQWEKLAGMPFDAMQEISDNLG